MTGKMSSPLRCFPQRHRCGLIEAAKASAAAMLSAVAFRSVIAAASLKPDSPRWRGSYGRGAFRSVIAAASLKRFDDVFFAPLAFAGFPQRHRCGLIEALIAAGSP